MAAGTLMDSIMAAIVLVVSSSIEFFSHRSIALQRAYLRVNGFHIRQQRDIDKQSPCLPEMDDEQLYSVAVRKGQHLAWRFSADNPPSEWQSFNDLAIAGWRRTHEGTHVPDHRIHGGTSRIDMYRDLGLSLHARDNAFFKWEHVAAGWAAAAHNRPARYYQPTGGHYQCVYNPAAIIAFASESPATMGYDEGIEGADVVPLCHWSDVVYLQWEQYCRENGLRPSNLRIIIQNDVDNRTTHRIVAYALERAGLAFRPWGHGVATFEFGSEEFCAILASPNGVGPAHLLLDHQATMGKMVITAVGCFFHAGDPYKTVNLCFHVAPFQ